MTKQIIVFQQNFSNFQLFIIEEKIIWNFFLTLLAWLKNPSNLLEIRFSIHRIDISFYVSFSSHLLLLEKLVYTRHKFLIYFNVLQVFNSECIQLVDNFTTNHM